ncbi:MAG TPA: hypothetical protein DGT21_22700 [Armatimonadetes bacterium]|jgi:uncharacterized protein with HEPN domain|nr:hypothetical protein [Armatimonadota bacterium]
MRREEDALRLKHMLEAARKAAGFAAGRTRDEIRRDDLLAFAIVRALEILGEAAGRVSPECRARHDALPWAMMVGMRNRLVHGYFDINLDIVWDTVTTDLPPVIAALQDAVSEGRDEAQP